METQQVLQSIIEAAFLCCETVKYKVIKDTDEYNYYNVSANSTKQIEVQNIMKRSKDIDDILFEDEESDLTQTEESNNVQEENMILEKEVQNLNIDLDKIKNELTVVEEEITLQEQEITEQFRSLKKESKKNKLKYDVSNELLRLTQDITNIRWAPEVPPHIVKGFVINKKNKRLIPFCYDKGKESQSEIRTKLWKLIEDNAQ